VADQTLPRQIRRRQIHWRAHGTLLAQDRRSWRGQAPADGLDRQALRRDGGRVGAAYLADKDKTAIRAVDLRGAWKQAEKTFGHLRPDQITRDLCRSYRDQRYEAGRKPNTVRKELEVVRAALNFHKKGEHAVFELPQPPPPKERYLTREEARRLLKACRRFPHVRAFIALSLATAARQSALLELTWDRVDLKRRRITLALGDSQDQDRKRRATVPMNRRAYLYLSRSGEARHLPLCDRVGRPPGAFDQEGFRGGL
jgi:integrase